MTEDVEHRLAERAQRHGMELRVEQRPNNNIWVAGFWTRDVPAELVPDGVMKLGAEALTREQAVADLDDLVKLIDAEGS
jgi:hypothetical protein